MKEMKKGEQYIEPLLARKSLTEYEIIKADSDSIAAIDQF
jgi:hypothetical protein